MPKMMRLVMDIEIPVEDPEGRDMATMFVDVVKVFADNSYSGSYKIQIERNK